MSHYTVAVITKDGDYDSVLKPFSESLPVKWEKELTREENIESLRKEYNSSEENKKWLEKRYDFSSDEALFESYKKSVANDPSIKFDEEGNEWHGYNPDGKWDWYNLGGRWSGEILKTKDGEETDHEQVKNLDLSPRKLTDEQLAHYKRFWEINVEGAKPKDGLEAEKYFSLYKSLYYKEEYGDFDGYIESITKFSTYAFIYNGEWIEPGKMGWFAIDDSTLADKQAYRKKLWDIIENLDPDDYISIIDCHV